MKTSFFAGSLLLLSVGSMFAGKDSALQPALAKAGKVLHEDSFVSDALGKDWSPNKGDWQIREGACVGRFRESDHHAAVLLLSAPHRDSIIKFSFKFEGSKGFSLSYNHAKGHLFRVNVAADGLTVNRDKDKKDPKSKSLTLAAAQGRVEPDQWHTMLVEVKGPRVSVQTDFGLKLEGKAEDLNVDKTGFRFVTGSSVTIDDLKAWKAE